MSDLNLGIIGNGTFGALIDQRGRIVWACLPRFDSDPVFSVLVNNGTEKAGYFDVEIDDFARSEQEYAHNSAVLVTRLYDQSGAGIEITDFAPRFKQFDRFYRPAMIVRKLRPLRGEPRVRVRLRPTTDYGAGRAEIAHGSNHIRYITPTWTLRLNTDAPIPYVLDETWFVMEESFTLLLGPDESLTRPLAETADHFLEQTEDYWREWVRYLSVPFEWQDAVIRAAITLKLCSFEHTGAIAAALTTSIPEAADSGRNWDYRFCWLRDAYFVVHALNRLGATRTMEDYLRYITNVILAATDGHLQPVYGISLETRLVERRAEALSGYRGMGPVRIGNQAYEHIQNDVYGSVILATTQTFFDQRLKRPGSIKLFERLEHIGEQAVKVFDQPDAGLWELRTKAHIHTFSSVMCWAACDRLAKVAQRLELGDRQRFWRDQANRIREVILKRAWNAEMNSFTAGFEGDSVDASLLLMQELGFIEATDPRFLGTLAAIEQKLRRGPFLFRYAVADDFGEPENAFNICTFWYIDALAAVGRRDEARELFENMLTCRNHVGLLSEDIDPARRELWGNFPQTYSMVGLINSAMRLSKTWEEGF